MAAVSKAPGLPSSSLQFEAESLSTLPDPRSPDEFPSPQRSDTSLPHPDLNSEVATLSNKLISAINHQTNLDDTLAATRQELETSQKRVQVLELENSKHASLIASGFLVRKSEAEEQATKLVAKLAEERKRRTVVEKDKKGIEQELENLTTALFEEANQMVAAARKEREAAERRSDQIRAQLNDTELLLASHQEQLAELKGVMQHMHADRDEPETAVDGSTAPSTPALPQNGELSRASDALHLSPTIPGVDDIAPGPPTSFPHLLSPILRTDLQSYEDFRSLIQISRKSAPASRVTSGSYTGANVVGYNNLTNGDCAPLMGHLPSNSSTTSLPTPNNFQQTPSTTPNTPALVASSIGSPTIQLKETRFYKRALTEDIEPTLRLDTAPGLSWLARRTVINSMCDGTLVVEPMPASNKMHIFPCALCGENRKGEVFTRTHRFRTSENENAQRYPLCSYCLNRVRASCDYLGFLRMIKDGHWRTDGVEAEKLAWEESVRLRERMFWARIGGGVVPAFIHRESPRVSSENAKPSTSFSVPSILDDTHSKHTLTSSYENKHPFHPSVEKSLIARTAVLKENTNTGSEKDEENLRKPASYHGVQPSLQEEADSASRQLQSSLRDSLKPRPRSRAASYERERKTSSREVTPVQVSASQQRPLPFQITNEQGLSITIPGAFEF
ncbi:rab guanine nucleotide exchange factor S2 [Xylographa parallela]|nr:rab guanine nucleotide exchange factor S2 [Xylographa parallela]